MGLGRLNAIGICLLNLCIVAGASAQSLSLERRQAPDACAQANLAAKAPVRAPGHAGPYLSFCDGRPLDGNLSLGAGAEPLSLASADFDEDGTPDLASGFSVGGSGVIAVYRGNVAALWPYGAAVRNGVPAPFFPGARTFSVPEAPDFLVAGDFDADGRLDLVAARRGGNALWFLRGDGHGGFAPAQRLPVDGSITALISGEMNRADGLADLVIGVDTAVGPRVLVYESPRGAVRAQPEIFRVARSVTALALGHFDGTGFFDLAIAAGDQLVVVHGRDRKLSLDSAQRASVKPARVTVQQFNFNLQALAAGDFLGAGPSLAALGDDGRIHILEHMLGAHNLLERMIDDPDFQPSFQPARTAKEEKALRSGGKLSPSLAVRLEVLRGEARQGSEGPEWTERSTVALPAGFSQSTPRLIAGRLTGSMEEDLLAPDAGNNRLHVFSTVSRTRHPGLLETGHTVTAAQMQLLDSFESESAPVAVLPMRLSRPGLQGVVVLQQGLTYPTSASQTYTDVFTVTNTSDITSVSQRDSPPPGSLRAALEEAASASGQNGGGSYEIAFDIPTTDPGYNSTTGTFLIQPLSENVPGSLDNFALPPINATVTIDGYTQPGASPNTLATGGNAAILIQIDGSLATTPGGTGLSPFDDVGSVYRGMDFTGWTNPYVSGGTASGAEGIEANGVGDFIEGNYFGTDPTGSLSTNPTTSTSYGNRIGVFVDNGPENNAGGNIIGGTTPEARNILSNNEVGGILFLSIAYEGQAQGNFIGLDHTGAAALPNTDDGVGSNGPTIVIGGIAPNSGNVISQNTTDIDFNDITNGGVAANSFAWGNLIGTDSTGTIIFSPAGTGASVTFGANDETFGGTTPAARNVISGNLYGVYLFNDTSGNIIQGNYIGTDITGSVALGNSLQGYISGASSSSDVAAVSDVLGGAVANAGNVISGNGMGGVLISGTIANSAGAYLGSTVEGNYIGTDATGTMSVPNSGDGIELGQDATSNIVGGTDPGAGNIIANNSGNGVHVNPGTPSADTPGDGYGNNTVGNVILNNTGTGVRIDSGSQELISRNSIYGNGDLGIALGTGGPSINTNCQSSASGPNNLQNAPALTAGTGTVYITATATDPNGNTSEFSNAVEATSTGDMLSLLGNFNSLPSTTYTIEFFSSPTADASGYGQGETYLGSTTVTTDASCSVAVNNPVNTDDADVSISLSSNQSFGVEVGPDFGDDVYTASVANNGPATATDVVVTDTLPTSLEVSSAYCDVGACQSPITTSLGSCTVSGQIVTCNLGTMAPGATATVNIPVQVLASGSIANTASVTATQTDPNPANNSSTVTVSSTYPEPIIDTGASGSVPNIVPGSVLAGSPDTQLTVYGFGFLPSSTVTFNGTPVTVSGFVDNQTCQETSPEYCAALQFVVPASLLTTAGTPTIEVSDPNPGPGGGSNTPSDDSYTIAASCTFTTDGQYAFDFIDQDGTDSIPVVVDVSPSAPSCSWTATSSVPWIVLLDTYQTTGFDVFTNIADTGTATGNASANFAVAANTGADSRTGSITVAGQTFSFTQPGASSCDESTTPTSQSFPVAGGSGTFAVTSGCFAYYVESYAPWITVPESSGLLGGNASANFTVAQNVGGPRTGTITAGGAVFTVTQAAPSCYYSLDTTSALVSANGTTGTINVTASAPTCTWTATPSSSQITINSGATTTGSGPVNYTVAPNTGAPISPTITVGDANANVVFTANEASPFTCTFSLSPATSSVSSEGISTYFLITASQAFCQWTAVSSDPADLTVNGSGSGGGSGQVFYRVSQNDTGAPRTLTITAGCQTFTINQSAVPAANLVPAITAISPATVAAASPNFTLSVTGSNFAPGATISLNGIGVPTTYGSATQVSATVTTSLIAVEGTYNVAVTNPSPGGGISNTLPLTVTAATDNPVPVITESFPGSSPLNGPAITVTVEGLNYVSGSTLSFNGTPISTTFLSGTSLTGVVPASDLTVNGDFPIVVTNPAPGGGVSNATDLSVGSGTGTPTITLLQPASIAAGSAAFTLNVIGANYVSGSVVNFNGTAMTTTQLGAAELGAAIPASAITTQGTVPVTVTNPSGGGTSNAVTFTITAASGNPVPAITTLQPSSATAGSGAFTLTVNGSGFISSSVVSFNGNARATAYVSASQLTAAILATDIVSAGTAPVTVTNPSPGGGTSNAVTFTINAASGNPVPAITTLQPSSATAGSAAFTLTVNGSGFISTSVVDFNSNARNTTYVSATQLTAAILATDIASAGTAPVTVTNPSPGGGTSTAVDFTINAASENPVPAITTLQPSSATAGSGAFTLTVNGSGFISSSVVDFNGNARTTTYVSATQLTAAILASDLTTAGTPSVTVVNPSPGGGTSNAVTFTINAAPVPSFMLSSTTGPQTIQPGQSAQYTITATAQNGTFPGSIAFTVSGLPPGATGTFAPTSVTPGSSSATTQLTIQTAASQTAFTSLRRGWPLAAFTLPLLLLFLDTRRARQRWLRLALMLLACLAAGAALNGCGAGFGVASQATPQTYTVTITGSGNGEQQTTTVQLTVE